MFFIFKRANTVEVLVKLHNGLKFFNGIMWIQKGVFVFADRLTDRLTFSSKILKINKKRVNYWIPLKLKKNYIDRCNLHWKSVFHDNRIIKTSNTKPTEPALITSTYATYIANAYREALIPCRPMAYSEYGLVTKADEWSLLIHY